MAGRDLQTTEPAQVAATLAFGDLVDWEKRKGEITTVQQCDEALALYDRQLVPVVEGCPELLSLDEQKVAAALAKNQYAKGIAAGLKMLGRKVMPTASADQVQHWLAAVAVSLCQLPGPVALAAVKAARISPTPPRFAPEIEPLVLECAKEAQARYDRARFRLRQLRKELDLIENPPDVLPPPPPPTPEEWDEFNANMRALGMKTRYFKDEDKCREITSDDIDPAPPPVAEDSEQNSGSKPKQPLKAERDSPLSPEEFERRKAKLQKDMEDELGKDS